MSTEIKKLNDNALNKWKAELYYCSKNFKKDKAYFNRITIQMHKFNYLIKSIL